MRRRLTAQETFNAMLREQVAPRLRALGFRGSGQSYSLPSDEAWVLVGFQKFKWSDQEEVEFTLNLTVGSKAAWDEARAERPYLPQRPSANTFYGTYVWQERIGSIVGRGDRIWKVRAARPTDAVAEDLLTEFESKALPVMLAKLGELQEGS